MGSHLNENGQMEFDATLAVIGGSPPFLRFASVGACPSKEFTLVIKVRNQEPFKSV